MTLAPLGGEGGPSEAVAGFARGRECAGRQIEIDLRELALRVGSTGRNRHRRLLAFFARTALGATRIAGFVQLELLSSSLIGPLVGSFEAQDKPKGGPQARGEEIWVAGVGSQRCVRSERGATVTRSPRELQRCLASRLAVPGRSFSIASWVSLNIVHICAWRGPRKYGKPSKKSAQMPSWQEAADSDQRPICCPGAVSRNSR